MIDGHLLVKAGGQRHDLGPGCSAWLPRQSRHAFANVSARPVHLFCVAVPGVSEEFFASYCAYFAQLKLPPDPERLAAIWPGHGRIVGPPFALYAIPVAVRS